MNGIPVVISYGVRGLIDCPTDRERLVGKKPPLERSFGLMWPVNKRGLESS